MSDMPTFASQIEAMSPQMAEFIGSRLEEVKTHLKAADTLLQELRGQGFTVTIRHPIGVNDGLALTAVEVAHILKFGRQS